MLFIDKGGKHLFRFFRSFLTGAVYSLSNASGNKTARPTGGQAPWKKTEQVVVQGGSGVKAPTGVAKLCVK